MDMATVIVIGVAGEDGLWVADLDAGTIVALSTPASGDLKTIADLRPSGTVITKGIDMAVVVKSAEAAASGHYFG